MMEILSHSLIKARAGSPRSATQLAHLILWYHFRPCTPFLSGHAPAQRCDTCLGHGDMSVQCAQSRVAIFRTSLASVDALPVSYLADYVLHQLWHQILQIRSPVAASGAQKVYRLNLSSSGHLL